MKKLFLYGTLCAIYPIAAMEMKSTAEQTSNRVTYCYVEIDGEKQKEFHYLKLLSYINPQARQQSEQAEQAMEELRSYFESEFNEQHQCSCNRLCCLRWTCGLRADDPTIDFIEHDENHYDINGARYQLLKPSYDGVTWLLPYFIPHCLCMICNDPEYMPEFGDVFFNYQKVCALAQQAMPYATLHHPDEIDLLIAQQHEASMTSHQEMQRRECQEAEVQAQKLR